MQSVWTRQKNLYQQHYFNKISIMSKKPNWKHVFLLFNWFELYNFAALTFCAHKLYKWKFNFQQKYQCWTHILLYYFDFFCARFLLMLRFYLFICFNKWCTIVIFFFLPFCRRSLLFYSAAFCIDVSIKPKSIFLNSIGITIQSYTKLNMKYFLLHRWWSEKIERVWIQIVCSSFSTYFPANFIIQFKESKQNKYICAQSTFSERKRGKNEHFQNENPFF